MGGEVTKIESKQKQMKPTLFHMNSITTLEGWEGLMQVTLEHIILNIYSKPGGNSQILNSLGGLFFTGEWM